MLYGPGGKPICMNIPDDVPGLELRMLFFIVIMSAGTLICGCMQPSGTAPAAAPGPVTTITPPGQETPVPAMATAVMTPRESTPIIRTISQVRDIRDTELLFALRVPAEWNVTTYRASNPRNTEGLLYRTDLVGNDTFFITTYAITRNQDQAYRDGCRMWSPAPVETEVTINGITADRFESVYGGRINVSYIVRKGSANERGFASVLSYSANASDPFEKEDFEKVAASFRYFSGSMAGTVPGAEILRILPPPDTSGHALSATGGGGSGGSPGGGSPGGGSSGGGGGCGCG